MFCRSVSWFICTFAAVAIVTGYVLPASNTAEAGTGPAADLGSLLDDGEDATVAVVAGDTRLRAHWAVLAARSPVFHRELLDEGSAHVVVVAAPQLEGPALRQLLAYLYNQQITCPAHTAPQLLAAADRYGLPALKAGLEQQLAAQLSVENAAAWAVLAIRHSCDSLKRAAVAFIGAHHADVLATRGWEDAVLTQHEAVTELIRLLSAAPPETSSAAPEAGGTPYPATQPPSHQTLGTALAGQTMILSIDDYTDLVRRLSADEKTRILMEAAKEGALLKLEALKAAAAEMEAAEEGGDGWTALHWAAAKGQLEAVRWLLEAEAAPDAVGRGLQWTPLHAAARWGHAGVVRLLLAWEADPIAGDLLSRTPLHWAAYYGHAEAVAALLEAGADRRDSDFQLKTALDLAREEGRRQVVRLLEA